MQIESPFYNKGVGGKYDIVYCIYFRGIKLLVFFFFFFTFIFPESFLYLGVCPLKLRQNPLSFYMFLPRCFYRYYLLRHAILLSHEELICEKAWVRFTHHEGYRIDSIHGLSHNLLVTRGLRKIITQLVDPIKLRHIFFFAGI